MGGNAEQTSSAGTPKRARAANVAAAKRAAQAVELRRGRTSYAAIAEALGYASPSAAWKAVHRALERETAGQVDELRREETDMIERLHFAWWRRALAGDLDAAKLVLGLSVQRARLLGLYAPTRIRAEVTEETRERLRDLVDKVRALPPADAEVTTLADRRRGA